LKGPGAPLVSNASGFEQIPQSLSHRIIFIVSTRGSSDWFVQGLNGMFIWERACFTMALISTVRGKNSDICIALFCRGTVLQVPNQIHICLVWLICPDQRPLVFVVSVVDYGNRTHASRSVNQLGYLDRDCRVRPYSGKIHPENMDKIFSLLSAGPRPVRG
jgi:hypothetical protein